MSDTLASGKIDCSAQPLDIAFHPENPDIVIAGLVDGTLEVHNLPPKENNNNKKEINDDDNNNTESSNKDNDDDDDDNDTILASISLERKKDKNDTQQKEKIPACRNSMFVSNNIICCSVGTDVCGLDVNRACSLGGNEDSIVWRLSDAMNKNVQALHVLPQEAFTGPSVLCVGDENGAIKLFDIRQCSNNNNNNNTIRKACVHAWRNQEDYISAFDNDSTGTTLLSTSADGTLAATDLRMMRQQSHNREGYLRLSDPQDDELLSLQIIKNGRKVVCGTQDGVLAIWSWGTWGDVSDRFPGHPTSIDALLKYDENTVLTGSSDGVIRIVQIQPDELLGVLGRTHEHDYPIERLRFNSNKSYVASISHDEYIRLWDIHDLMDDDDDDDDENTAKEQAKIKPTAAASLSTFKHNSDDEWDDDDDNNDGDGNDEDDSDSDSDSDDEKEASNNKPKKRFKTEAEDFFSDL